MNLIFNRVGIIAIIRNSIKNSLTIIRKLYKVVKQLCDAFLWLFLILLVFLWQVLWPEDGEYLDVEHEVRCISEAVPPVPRLAEGYGGH